MSLKMQMNVRIKIQIKRELKCKYRELKYEMKNEN